MRSGETDISDWSADISAHPDWLIMHLNELNHEYHTDISLRKKLYIRCYATEQWLPNPLTRTVNGYRTVPKFRIRISFINVYILNPYPAITVR